MLLYLHTLYHSNMYVYKLLIICFLYRVRISDNTENQRSWSMGTRRSQSPTILVQRGGPSVAAVRVGVKVVRELKRLLKSGRWPCVTCWTLSTISQPRLTTYPGGEYVVWMCIVRSGCVGRGGGMQVDGSK